MVGRARWRIGRSPFKLVWGIELPIFLFLWRLFFLFSCLRWNKKRQKHFENVGKNRKNLRLLKAAFLNMYESFLNGIEHEKVLHFQENKFGWVHTLIDDEEEQQKEVYRSSTFTSGRKVEKRVRLGTTCKENQILDIFTPPLSFFLSQTLFFQNWFFHFYVPKKLFCLLSQGFFSLEVKHSCVNLFVLSKWRFSRSNTQ